MNQAQERKLERQVRDAERGLMREKQKLARLRRRLPPRPVEDYELLGADGKPVRLSQLFRGKSDLLVVHNMGKSCPYCALWADGFNGMLRHLEDRAGFAVESPDPPKVIRTVARRRGWKFTFVSSAASRFREEMGFAEKGEPWPGVSAFHRDDRGRIFRVSSALFGPGDSYCSLWDLFDLLRKGADGWEARFTYS